ncbi:hypothetical protein [Lutibacter citreus]|uniref:hypothetical protein n=1 Tax=Lutibacter citreus TaxID=2138210 RepID=UPI000DBE1553|nr:hypothetical protein [Lutibacter citreus]
MKNTILKLSVIFIIIIGIFSSFKNKPNPNCSKILELPSLDGVFINDVYFCETETEGAYYYSKIETSVCSDTLCRIVNLKVYWDLAGNLKKFDTIPGKQLTKNDHINFTSEDYSKLLKTLKDNYSVIGKKHVGAFIEKDKFRKSDKIDGVSGATKRTIKEEAVEGALYSTHTLWKLINGTIKKQLKEYTNSNYSEKFKLQLLNSENGNTNLFALQKLKDDDYVEQFDLILKIMKKKHSLVNFYISKALPQSIFKDEISKQKLKNVWSFLDENSKSVLIENLN